MTSPDSSAESPRYSPLADVSAGVVVFLVALPLCLGIALASGAPLFSGILSGIVGGIVVGAISGSHTSVSGPAAGLTAVVAAQIASLGSFETFLMAVALAGALQIAMGLLRTGSIADFVPSSVIKGLLAAIGLIIILKQAPHLVGHDRIPMGVMSFRGIAEGNTFTELVGFFHDIHPGAAVVGFLSIAIMVFWEKFKWLKRLLIPAPLVVVLVAVATVWWFARLGGVWVIGVDHLVQVPVAETLVGFFDFLSLPDFRSLARPEVLVAAVTIALVASLETLLNVEAVDKLDPHKRVSPPNRELIAQGVGNMTAGLIGGLPVTSVIVRSSVNLNAGARTKFSAIFHGVLLLGCVMLLPTWLNRIPLSCLAAVLVMTGLKLATPKLFKQMWREGSDQFLPFIVTVSAILLTDLLMGILIGLGFSILFILRSNLRRPLHQVIEKHVGGEVLHIELAHQVSFLNRVALSRALKSVSEGGHVLIDARETDYIDADVLDLIMEYQDEIAPVRGVQVSLLGFKDRYKQIEDQIQYVDFSSRELQASLSPDKVLQILQDGNERFRTGQPLTRDLMRQLKVTAASQHPLAVVLTGCSSRTPVEVIFDVGVGDISCARVTGNHIGPGVLGSLEYACSVTGAKLIVVMGHSNSAVMRMAIEAQVAGKGAREITGCEHLDPILSDVSESLEPRFTEGWHALDDEQRKERVDALYRVHVSRTIERLLERSRTLRGLFERGEAKVVGAMYDVRTGQVDFFS
jgi:carbonic anhydrase